MRRYTILRESKSIRNYNLDEMISSIEKDVREEYDYYAKTHKPFNMDRFKSYFCDTIGKELFYGETFHDFGTFDVDYFHVRVVMYDDVSSYGFTVPELCDKNKRLVVVILSSKFIPEMLNGTGKLFNTLTHEIRHGEDIINDRIDTDFEMMGKTAIKFYGETYNVEKFSNTDDSIKYVTYFLTRIELKGYIQSVGGILRRYLNESNPKLLRDALVRLAHKMKKPLKFHRLYDLFSKNVDGKRLLLELFINESNIFRIYFRELNEIMVDYSFFKKYIIDSIESHKKDMPEYVVWLKNMLDSQYFPKDDNRRKKHNDMFNSLMKKYMGYGMNPIEALQTYIENDYSKILYDMTHGDYMKFIAAVVKNLIEEVSRFDSNKEAVEKLKKEFKKS